MELVGFKSIANAFLLALSVFFFVSHYFLFFFLPWVGCVGLGSLNWSSCCKIIVVMVCVVRQNLYVFSLYCKPWPRWKDFWLFTSINGCHTSWGCRASFLFVGDLNGHHQEWLGSMTTNSHGVAAFDFVTVSCCNQFIVSPTHAGGGTLDLLMTDVPDLVQVAVVVPLGNSDYSSLSAVISMAQAVANLCFSRKVFLKHQVNWNAVCGAIRDLPWHNIRLADNWQHLACWQIN